MVALIAWLIRDLAVWQRTQADSPILPEEVRGFFPGAAILRPDDSARDGLFIIDREGRELGYIVRTQPQCAEIIGYCGVTDVLVLFEPDWKIVGLKIHASDDTREHVEDVALDRRFLKKWNGLEWSQAAALDLKRAGIEGVSGATMTSMAIARSVKARLQARRDEIVARPALQLGWRDWGMAAVIGTALLMAFGRSGWRRRWRRPYQLVVLVYVGLFAGDMVAQALVAGWARSGIPWTTAPGLVLLAAAALVVPWATRSPLYCHHICPHGIAQEWIGRLRPARWRVTLPAGAVRGLAYLPAGLLAFVLVATMLQLPFELAGIEPFDAYLVRTAGWATLVVAAVGLLASCFVPHAYCRFGCPTGALLGFVRTRGHSDSFSRRDAAAFALAGLAVAINASYDPLIQWVKGLP